MPSGGAAAFPFGASSVSCTGLTPASSSRCAPTRPKPRPWNPGAWRSRAMSQENADIVLDWYAAFNRGDIDATVAFLTDDFDMRVPAYAVDGISYSGPDGYAAWHEGLAESWS